MPNVFVANEKITAAGLADALLKSKVTAKNRAAALVEIGRANPGLDLSAIRPGTVVVVPQLPGLKPTATADPAGNAADDQVARLTEGLTDLLAAAEAGEEQRKRDTDAALAALDAVLATGLAERIAPLAANAESARDALISDAEEGAQNLDALRAARDGWLAGLEKLRGLL